MSVLSILILVLSATSASKFIQNDDFWPPLQEQWRCMHTPQQHSNSYVLETNYLINYFENPDVDKIDFDCPVIDPNDPEWCPENSNGEYYRVNCNCHAYYRCEVHSSVPPYAPKPCIYKCLPHDLVFDPNTKSCVREDVAPPGTCFDTSTPRPTGTTTTTIPTRTTSTSPQTTPTTITTTTSTTTITHTTTSTTITTTTITHTTTSTTITTPATIPTTITTPTTTSTTAKTTTTSIPPTITPLAICYIKVIDATTNKLLTNIDYIYTIDGGPDIIDSDSSGAFALTVPVNSTLDISVSKNGFYDESMTGLIDEDKFWLIVMIPSDGKDRIVLSWTARKPKDLDLQLTIGEDCIIFTNQRNCSGAHLDTDWKQGGTEAGDGGVETITIDRYQDPDTKYMVFVSNIANDEYPMSGSNAVVTLYFGNQFKTISAPNSGDQTDSKGNGFWIIGCFTGFTRLGFIDERNIYSDNYEYDCYPNNAKNYS